jgi:O-succinylhomoserine sulfhydrylase
MPIETRRETGIGEGMLRVAVGLESVEDICEDLARGM